MPVAPNSIVTTQGLRTAQAVCTAAKTTYSDITNAVLLVTAGENGSLVKRLRAVPRATVTATNCMVLRNPAATSDYHLVDCALMAAHTVAVTTAIPETDFGYTADNLLRLGPGEKLYVGAAVALAGGIVFDCELEDF